MSLRTLLSGMFADAGDDIGKAHIGYFDMSGQFLCDPNEMNTWGIIGPHDNTNTQDVGNANATNFSWVAGGYTRPYQYEIRRIYLRLRESNDNVQPWGLILGHSTVATSGNDTSALVPNYLLDETGDNGNVGPRNHGNTGPYIVDLDLTSNPNKIVPAMNMLTFGISSPTAAGTNYYIQISTGFIEYKRVL